MARGNLTVARVALFALGAALPWAAAVVPAAGQSRSEAPTTTAHPPSAAPASRSDAVPANSRADETPPAPAVSNMSPRPRAAGYLGEQRLPDHRVFLPPPPAPSSAREKADVAIFRETRALEGGPRWQLAAKDDRVSEDALLGAFSCAAGLDLAAAEAPALERVIARSRADLFFLVSASKDLYQRPRPFLTEQGPLCVTPSEALRRQGSYPSGHTASSWLHALLLAEVDSAHAAAIVARGRAFGESRVVCGVHYLSDIEGARLLATALVAALHGEPEFDADIAAAREEVAALRASGSEKPASQSCESERALLATPW